MEGETQLDNKDFKNTLKLTWLAETSLAPLTTVTCAHFDNVMTKAKLDEGDTFENFVNYASKVNNENEKLHIKIPYFHPFRVSIMLSENLIWRN